MSTCSADAYGSTTTRTPATCAYSVKEVPSRNRTTSCDEWRRKAPPRRERGRVGQAVALGWSDDTGRSPSELGPAVQEELLMDLEDDVGEIARVRLVDELRRTVGEKN